MNQDKIGIIGCGWLGLPLAKSLISNNYKVKGSTTRKNKLTVLKKEGIDPFLIEITDNSISESISSFLKGLDILIINIPPRIPTINKPNPNQEIVTYLILKIVILLTLKLILIKILTLEIRFVVPLVKME